MKKAMSAIRSLILCLGLLSILCPGMKSNAAKYLNVETRVKNKTTVEISWKKKSVSGYEIYRLDLQEGTAGKYKKIATVSAKKKKYVDKTAKYKKHYLYTVKAFTKKGNKKTYKYKGSNYAWMSMRAPVWDEYLYCESATTPDCIPLTGYSEGITADAFEIYRKENGEAYKKIKTIKAAGSGNSFEYADRTVVKGKKYSYKIRSRKKINGKNLYSKYSSPVKLTAVNRDAIYTLTEDTVNSGKIRSLILGLTSDGGNGKTIFSDKEADSIYYTYRLSPKADSKSVYLTPVKYSFDRVNWTSFPGKGVTVPAGQTIYIMLEEENSKEFDFYSNQAACSELEWYLKHNERSSILTVDFIARTAKTHVNGEVYH